MSRNDRVEVVMSNSRNSKPPRRPDASPARARSRWASSPAKQVQ
jgi:hypothetical protein